jgi:feruloyl-CoA synthase
MGPEGDVEHCAAASADDPGALLSCRQSVEYRPGSGDVRMMNPSVNRPRLGAGPVRFTHHADGALLVTPAGRLGPYPASMTDRLRHWAGLSPDRIYMAERGADGAWVSLTYAEALRRAEAVGEALLRRGLSAERPLAILSGNDLDHAVLALGAMLAGVPHAPISLPYSLASEDHAKLREVLALLTPGLVFAADGARFAKAIAAAVAPDTEVVVARHGPEGRSATSLAELLATPPGAALHAAAAKVGPETIAKFLFTSGSTGTPKAVITTQRMLTSNQQMLLEAFPFMGERPPVLLDWLPWNHTFGGSHNTGIVLYNGGTMYLDAGRPVPGGFEESLRNLREIIPSIYFNVPRGFEELVQHLRADRELRRRFFAGVEMLFYSAAGLPQHVWDALDDMALAERGTRLPMITGLGATETAPFALCVREDASASGHVGLPVPGLELKLAPVAGKMEARLRGPSVTPGYWRNPAATRSAFDEEGWYRFGDALDWIDAARPELGFRFDGRIAEDFKLSTGTFVSAGPLRAALIAAFAPFVKDAVICAPDRNCLTALLIPEPAHPATAEQLRERLCAMAGSGSSMRIERVRVLEEPLSMDAGELTDKGSVNQAAVRRRRAALVEALYAVPPGPRVISR